MLINLMDLEQQLRDQFDKAEDWKEIRKLTDDIGKVEAVKKMIADRNILTKEYYITK